ncbi:MAG: 50S ribosomal protein L17 [Candidatus Coatesbacteria bacterium]|nr:50S ribosomal protein L17 [Candidatus Coatesbacteria bacterium]
MRHLQKNRKLNRTASHREAMFSNMITTLFEQERIVTTVAKAKEARSIAERLVTYAKKGDLHRRRLAARIIKKEDILKKLFEDIAERFKDRNGGYTRILKKGIRAGDSAPLCFFELTTIKEKTEEEKETEIKKSTKSKPKVPKKKTAEKEEVKETAVEESKEEEIKDTEKTE